MLSFAPLVSYRPLAHEPAPVPPHHTAGESVRVVSRQAWPRKRAPTEDSIDESLSERSDRHAFASRNCIAAATHAANTGDHRDHAADA